MTLSAIIIAKNEADNIERCLTSLRFTNEQIVVDSGSTDGTIAIAQKLGARIIHQSWKGYGAQKNIGLEAAQGQWALFIDADEEVSPALAAEIIQAINNPEKDFYWLRIITIFLKKPLNHLYGHNPRLFKKSAGQWTSDTVHEQVETKNGTRVRLGDTLSKKLQTPLLHYSHETIRAYLNRMHTYTTLDAEQMAHTGRHRSGKPVQRSPFLPYKLASKQFIKLLIYRRGFLDGYAGILWSILSAYYEYEMARKYITA